MGRFRRKLWTAIVFIGLLGPFATLFALTILRPLPAAARSTEAARERVIVNASAAGGSMLDPRPSVPSAKIAPGPLFADGNGQAVWVARPMAVGDRKIAAFEVLVRANNSGLWSAVRPGGAAYFEGLPQGAVVMPRESGNVADGMVFVFGPGGRLTACSADRLASLASLPAEHRLLAATGAREGIFALTQGAAHFSTTRPGDRLDLTARDTAVDVRGEAAESAPSTRVAASASAPAPMGALETQPAALVNAYWFRGAAWVALPALGPSGSADTPGPDARVALAHVSGRLIALWVNAGKPQELVARARPDDRTDAAWSPAVRSPLPQSMDPEDRLLAMTMGRSVYLLYPTAAGKSFALVGGRLISDPAAAGDLTLTNADRLAPLFLGMAAEGVHPGADIAVGVSENSFIAVIAGADGVLRTVAFGAHGEPLSPARAVAITSPVHDGQVGQNVALLLVVLLMALSLWRWRRDPRAPVLPVGMQTASLPARGMAFLIDLAIPYLGVVVAWGLWQEGGYLSILDTWAAALTKPDELFSSLPLLSMLGLYTLHVAVGELFFRRSIGKALLGLEVLMIDGKAPTVAAVLVRNLVRLAEIVPAGILVFYMFISDYRQRLGDLLAHTVVVSHKAPQADVKDEAEGEHAEDKEEETAGKR